MPIPDYEYDEQPFGHRWFVLYKVQFAAARAKFLREHSTAYLYAQRDIHF